MSEEQGGSAGQSCDVTGTGGSIGSHLVEAPSGGANDVCPKLSKESTEVIAQSKRGRLLENEQRRAIRTETSILQVRFDLIDYEQTVETVTEWRRTEKRSYITITNPHSVLMCHRDQEMRNATARAGLTLPDGTGIIWAANILGYKHHGRVTGPILVLYLCDLGRCHGLRHYFYGGTEGVADKLSERLLEKFPGLEVVGTCCPPFRALTEREEATIVERINKSQPDILWIGLGAPKQEKWMARHFGRVEATAMIGVGAAFDFHSGSVKWAPSWIRGLGFEWAYRLAIEPKRLWRRNLDSPLFLMDVIAQRFRQTYHALLSRHHQPEVQRLQTLRSGKQEETFRKKAA